ncbi:hypothetical protein AOLI_G00020410 [Acnodon oligacanthus]
MKKSCGLSSTQKPFDLARLVRKFLLLVPILLSTRGFWVTHHHYGPSQLSTDVQQRPPTRCPYVAQHLILFLLVCPSAPAS